MTTLTKNLIALVIALFGVFGFYAFIHQQTVRLGDGTNYNPLPVDPTDSAVLCTSSSGLLLATSSAGRPLVYISNAGAVPIYLGMGHAAVATSGLMIPANSTFKLDNGSIFLKAIYCISASNATATISAVN